MTTCEHCQGRGHTAIVGDNDIECKACGGAGELVAVEMPLSAVAQLRIDFETYESLDHSFDQTTYQLWRDARDSIHDRNIFTTLRILFDTIDQQAAYITELEDIIHDCVGLSDIMREAKSQTIYEAVVHKGASK